MKTLRGKNGWARTGAWLCAAWVVAGCGSADEAEGSGAASEGPFASSAKDAIGGSDGAASDAAMAEVGALAMADSALTADSSSWWGETATAPADTAADVPGPDDAQASDGTAAADGGPAPGSAEADAAAKAQVWKLAAEAAQFASVGLGDGKKLTLAALRVTVQIDGLRARTLVDHIYHDPHVHPAGVEGRFRYALPAEAAVSYYAMFMHGEQKEAPAFFGKGDPLADADEETIAGALPQEVFANAKLVKSWGEAREAKVVPQVQATIAYETETAKKIDPALVEEVAPNTFEAKVFPIVSKGFVRILLAYEQTLPRIGGELQYAFARPKGDVPVFEFALIAAKAGTAKATYAGTVPNVPEPKGTAKSWLAKVEVGGNKEAGMLVYRFPPTAPHVDAATGTDPKTKDTYTYLRLQPDLKELVKAGASAQQAVFLLDSSLSQHPARFGIDVAILQGILENSPQIKKFRVATFDAGARWLTPTWLENDVAGRKAVLTALDGILLEGATDLGAALRLVAKTALPLASEPSLDVFLMTDGVVSWGDTSPDTLVGRWQAEMALPTRVFAYRTGIGAENLALFQALTAKGAIFNCLSQAEAKACSVAHQSAGILLDSVTIVPDGPDGGTVKDLLVAGRQATLFPGASLTVAARVLQTGKVKVLLSGSVPGQGKVAVEVPFDLQPQGQLAPRAWGEIAVAQLLATHDPKLEKLAIALSQHYRLASSVTSYLVLEKDTDYEKYAIYEVATEVGKLGSQGVALLLTATLAKLAKAWTTWDQLWTVPQQNAALNKVPEDLAKKVIAEMQAAVVVEDLQLPDSTLQIPMVLQASVPAPYVTAIGKKDFQDLNTARIEAERRRKEGQTGAAVRALSSLVELNQGHAEIERLVAYRLQTWDQGAAAASLLLNVLRKRPFEPQSYRDLALAVAPDRPAITAMLFETVLAGTWPAKFQQIKVVAKEEYALFVQEILALPKHPLQAWLTGRKAALNLPTLTGDLRVTLTWNTNATDIDLWVTSPLGEKCFYSHKKLSTGGELLDDLTGGFGPERFVAQKAMAGEWKIQAHYYANNGNAIVGETFVQATILTHAGTPAATVQHVGFLLAKKNDVAELGTVSFK